MNRSLGLARASPELPFYLAGRLDEGPSKQQSKEQAHIDYMHKRIYIYRCIHNLSICNIYIYIHIYMCVYMYKHIHKTNH